MKTFTQIRISSKIRNPKTNEVIIIKKFKKDGTKRVFFTPETESGQRLTKTMFSQLWQAETLAKRYLNR